MSLARTRNKVHGTDLNVDFRNDSAELLEDHFNNDNLDMEYDEVVSALSDLYAAGKRGKYEDDEPTDLSAKGGSSYKIMRRLRQKRKNYHCRIGFACRKVPILSVVSVLLFTVENFTKKRDKRQASEN